MQFCWIVSSSCFFFFWAACFIVVANNWWFCLGNTGRFVESSVAKKWKRMEWNSAGLLLLCLLGPCGETGGRILLQVPNEKSVQNYGAGDPCARWIGGWRSGWASFFRGSFRGPVFERSRFLGSEGALLLVWGFVLRFTNVNKFFISARVMCIH